MDSSGSLLAANLHALSQAQGRAVDLGSPRDSHVDLDSGPPVTALLRDADGRAHLVHSRRDPVAEAERALATAVAAAPEVVIVVGAGLGYVAEAALRLLPGSRVLVVEPDPAFAHHMLSRRDWSLDIASGRLVLLVGPDYAGASRAWRALDTTGPTTTLEHPVLARLRPAATEAARALVARLVFDARANATARARFEAPYLLNTLRNLPVLATEANVTALDGSFAGLPAIVVAAGPSLDDRLDELRAVGDRAVIVAVDTACHPLLQAGVVPDLVVAIDPGSANARHLEGLPPEHLPWLVGECSLPVEGFAPFRGRTFCTRIAAHEPWPALQAAGLDAGVLRAWGSVLTTAFDLTLRLGCDPVVFVGADLAYSGERPYCRSTVYEYEWAVAAARGVPLRSVWSAWLDAADLVTVPDVHGRDIATAPRLIAFRDWVVDAATAARGRRIVNATGGGILHGGAIELRGLVDAIGPGGATLPRDRFTNAWASSANANDGLARASRLVDALRRGDARVPLERWRTILGERAGDVDDVLRQIGEELGSSSTRAGPARVVERPSAYLPEHLSRLRTFLSFEGPPAHTGTAGVPDAAVDEALLTAALEMGHVAEAVSESHAALPVAGDSPWLPLTAGSVPATPYGVAVARVEGELGRALSAAPSARRPQRDALMALQVMRWRDESPRHREVPGALTTMAGLLEWALVAGTIDTRASVSATPQGVATLLSEPSRLARFLDELHRALEMARGGEAVGAEGASCVVSLETTGAGRGASASVRVRPRELMRSLSGLVVEEQPGGPTVLDVTLVTGDAKGRWRATIGADGPGNEPPGRFLGAGRAVVPVVMSGVLPQCLFASTLDDREAVLGSVMTPRSYAVDAAGRVRVLREWPRPIIADVPWGARGGALAWSNAEGDSYVMLRRDAHAEVEVADVPFRPTRPVIDPDGTTWWSSYFGGLWTWRPGESARRVADVPPCIGIRAEEAGLRLDPVATGPEGTVRTRDGSAWRWARGAAVATAVALAEDGPTWDSHATSGWTVEVYPHADTIRIATPGGRVFRLACYYPVSAGWAGESLVVVSTTSGVVQLFPGLRELLTRDECA